MFAALELFFVMNSRVVQFKKIRKMFPEKIKKTGAIPWTTEDIQKMLDVAKSKRNKALIHFLASTGCRIGSLVELKLKHVTDMSEDCKAVLFYEGSNEEYYSFLTPEASNALNEYHEERRKQGERLLPDSPVFSIVSQAGVSQRRVPDLSSIKSITLRLIQNSGTRGNRVHQRYDTQMDHGFRKRFNTILKSNDLANASLCEKMMHAEIKIGDSIIMLGEENPQMDVVSSVKGSTSSGVFLYMSDADDVFNKAVSAGAKPMMPMMDAFWGDRYGSITDPFGHVWSISTRKKDMTPDEISKAAQQAFKDMCK
jgi:uncharacterized glyoxalase superfamily protein PhnB